MNNFTTVSIGFLAAGIFTSLTILSAYQVLFAVSLIYYAFQSLRKRDFTFPPSSYFLGGFVLIAIISLFINFEITPSPLKNFGRVKDYLYGIFGILVLREWITLSSDKTKKNLLRLFCLSIIVAGSYAIWEYTFSGRERVKSLTDTMRYGYGSGMILLTMLSGILYQRKIKRWFDPIWGLVAFIFGFVGMYLTFTRGALLGFLCGLPFVLYFYRPKLGAALGSLIVVGILSLGGFYLFGSGEYESRFLMNKNNKSDVIRRSQWQAAIIAIKERPVLGWGLSNFHTQLKRIKYENDLDAKKYDDAHSHNLFLEVASGTGLIGLLFFLGWLLQWAREEVKAGEVYKALIIPFLISFVVSSQFEVTFDANNASMIFFLYAISSASKFYGQNKESKHV